MLPRSMFVNRDRYTTQINAYSKLIAGAVFLVRRKFEFAAASSRNLGDDIAEEIIGFETRLAKVYRKRLGTRARNEWAAIIV